MVAIQWYRHVWIPNLYDIEIASLCDTCTTSCYCIAIAFFLLENNLRLQF